MVNVGKYTIEGKGFNPIGSMGRLYYIFAWMVDFYGHVITWVDLEALWLQVNLNVWIIDFPVELVVEPTHLKNMLIKLDHFPRDRVENTKYLKPPPRKSMGGFKGPTKTPNADILPRNSRPDKPLSLVTWFHHPRIRTTGISWKGWLLPCVLSYNQMSISTTTIPKNPHVTWTMKFQVVKGSGSGIRSPKNGLFVSNPYISAMGRIAFHPLHRVFPKIRIPPKHPKMIIFSRKTHGCWVNPPF